MKKIFFTLLFILFTSVALAALTVNNVPKVKTGGTSPSIQNSSISDNGVTTTITTVLNPAGGVTDGTLEEADIGDLNHTATAITDGLIVEADLDEDSGTPTDKDVLTFNSTGANFNWVAQNTLAAGTAAALAANGANCTAGNAPLGVDASGAVESCFDVWTEAENTAAAYISDVADDSIDGTELADAITLDATTTVDMDTNTSDLNFDSNTLFIDQSTNRVGVGTSTPGTALDVNGELSATNVSFSGSMQIPNSATPTTDATGEIALDTTITDHQPLLQYYDGGENMTVIAIDTSELPALDGEIIKYNATTDKFYLGSESGGGSGAFSDASDPVVLNTTTKDVVIGTGAVNTSKLTIDGDADQVQLTVQGNGTQTDSVIIVETSAGTETLNIEADGTILTSVGIDAIGAVDMDYGSLDVTDHTFTTDGTGDAEIVLPTGSIGSTEILDATIVTGDVAADTITHANIADADQADTKCAYIEDPVAESFVSFWANKTANDFQITEYWAESDQTISVDLQVDDGTPADCDASPITPASGEAEDTSISGDCLVAAGEELDLVLTSPSGTPTYLIVCFTGNWVD